MINVDGLFFDAYEEIATDRSMGGAIPYSAISTWAHDNGLSGMMRVLVPVIRRMDQHWRRWAKEQEKSLASG